MSSLFQIVFLLLIAITAAERLTHSGLVPNRIAHSSPDTESHIHTTPFPDGHVHFKPVHHRRRHSTRHSHGTLAHAPPGPSTLSNAPPESSSLAHGPPEHNRHEHAPLVHNRHTHTAPATHSPVHATHAPDRVGHLGHSSHSPHSVHTTAAPERHGHSRPLPMAILHSHQVHSGESGAHSSDFETENGIRFEFSGSQGENGGAQMIGSYSYPMEDGTMASFNFVADENGYQPQSDLLPVAPAFPHPIPQFVLDQIEFARLQEERRARDGHQTKESE